MMVRVDPTGMSDIFGHEENLTVPCYNLFIPL